MTYNVFGGTLNLTQLLMYRKKMMEQEDVPESQGRRISEAVEIIVCSILTYRKKYQLLVAIAVCSSCCCAVCAYCVPARTHWINFTTV